MQENGYFHFFLLINFYCDFQHCLLDHPLNIFTPMKDNDHSCLVCMTQAMKIKLENLLMSHKLIVWIANLSTNLSHPIIFCSNNLKNWKLHDKPFFLSRFLNTVQYFFTRLCSCYVFWGLLKISKAWLNASMFALLLKQVDWSLLNCGFYNSINSDLSSTM